MQLNPIYNILISIFLYIFCSILCYVVYDTYDCNIFYLFAPDNYWNSCILLILISFAILFCILKKNSTESNLSLGFFNFFNITFAIVTVIQSSAAIFSILSFDAPITAGILIVLINILAIILYVFWIYIIKLSYSENKQSLSRAILCSLVGILMVISVTITQDRMPLSSVYNLSRDSKMFYIINSIANRILSNKVLCTSNDDLVKVLSYSYESKYRRILQRFLKIGRIKYTKIDNNSFKFQWKPFADISDKEKAYRVISRLDYNVNNIKGWYYGLDSSDNISQIFIKCQK